MNIKRILTAAAVAALGIGGAVAMPMQASAHTPSASATCEVVSWDLRDYREKPASGASTVEVDNPAYVPATPGSPEVGTPTVVAPNPDYVAPQPAVYEDVVVKVEFKKWKVLWFDYQWFPVTAQPNPSSGWIATGNVKTESVLKTPEVLEQGTPTIEVPNPAYQPAVPATEAQGEPTIVVDNPDYSPADETPNTVAVTVDGEQVYTASFGSHESGEFTFANRYIGHDWAVTVSAWDDPEGSNGWSRTISGTTEPCALPTQPDAKVFIGAWGDGLADCETGTVTFERVVVTTPFVWDGAAWVEGESATETETLTVDATEEECPLPPVVEEPEPLEPPVAEEPVVVNPLPTAKVAPAPIVDALPVTGVDDKLSFWFAMVASGFIIIGGAAASIAAFRRR